MKIIIHVTFLLCIGTTNLVFSQANDCGEEVNVCTTPSFAIIPPDATNTIVDFTAGSGSDPLTNPEGFNSGCLISGETSSTFMLISVVSAGTLSWTIGADAGTGCFDWIMWPYTPGGATCIGLQNGTLAPVACNWNGLCEGFTGMAAAGSLPAGGEPVNFQTPLNVVPGNQYLLCLSNYSSVVMTVPINFIGTAVVSCSSLPTELMEIKTIPVTNYINVNWRVASENNVNFYELERSLDGLNFEFLTKQDAKGNSLVELNYAFNDFQVERNTDYYYRYKAVDFDGLYEYSPIVTSKLLSMNNDFNDGSVLIYPNPVNDKLIMTLSSIKDRTIQCEIFNSIDQIIYVTEESIVKGNVTIVLPVSLWASGMYTAKLLDIHSNEVVWKKIIKP
jgi:hypothetical protein